MSVRLHKSESKNMHLCTLKNWRGKAGAAGLLKLFSSRGPCNGGGVCARPAGQGLMQEALPPAFRIAKFVTGLVTLPEKFVR